MTFPEKNLGITGLKTRSPIITLETLENGHVFSLKAGSFVRYIKTNRRSRDNSIMIVQLNSIAAGHTHYYNRTQFIAEVFGSFKN